MTLLQQCQIDFDGPSRDPQIDALILDRAERLVRGCDDRLSLHLRIRRPFKRGRDASDRITLEIADKTESLAVRICREPEDASPLPLLVRIRRIFEEAEIELSRYIAARQRKPPTVAAFD